MWVKHSEHYSVKGLIDRKFSCYLSLSALFFFVLSTFPYLSCNLICNDPIFVKKLLIPSVPHTSFSIISFPVFPVFSHFLDVLNRFCLVIWPPGLFFFTRRHWIHNLSNPLFLRLFMTCLLTSKKRKKKLPPQLCWKALCETSVSAFSFLLCCFNSCRQGRLTCPRLWNKALRTDRP